MSRFFILMIAFLFYTVLRALVTWPEHRWLAGSLAVVVFALMISWQILYRNHPELINSTWFDVSSVVGSVLMAAWATYILFAITTDVLNLLATIFDTVFRVEHDPFRRALLSKGLRVGIVYGSGVMAAAGYAQVLAGPRVKKVSISSDKLPSALKGLKIAQLSDLHVGPNLGRGYMENVMQKTNAIHPDLIFITGDLADGKVEDLKTHFEPLSRLKAKYGIYYITGNHEYYWGAPEFIEYSKSMGFIPLVNENKIIDINGAKLMIAGITDPAAEHMLPAQIPNPQKAITSNEKSDFKILLAHRPDAIIEAEPLGFDLQFSGHTHAGQFFPFNLLVPLGNKFWHGLNRHGNMQVYVNAGTGYWGAATRFLIPSEISDITLA